MAILHGSTGEAPRLCLAVEPGSAAMASSRKMAIGMVGMSESSCGMSRTLNRHLPIRERMGMPMGFRCRSRRGNAGRRDAGRSPRLARGSGGDHAGRAHTGRDNVGRAHTGRNSVGRAHTGRNVRGSGTGRRHMRPRSVPSGVMACRNTRRHSPVDMPWPDPSPPIPRSRVPTRHIANRSQRTEIKHRHPGGSIPVNGASAHIPENREAVDVILGGRPPDGKRAGRRADCRRNSISAVIVLARTQKDRDNQHGRG